MALAQEFEYFKPRTLAQAIKLKAQFGAKGRFLAGGTDLINEIDDEVAAPEAVIDLKGIKELKELSYKQGKLRIGPLVTFTELLESRAVKQRFPLLWEAASEVASIALRNRATMVGNICSCVPCMDSAPALVVYGAAALIRGPEGERTIPIVDLFAGPRKTTIGADEIITGLIVPEPKKNGTSYVKLKRYRGEDLSQAGVAVMALRRNRYLIAYGSVGPVPIRAEKIEKLLNGKKLTPQLIGRAKRMVKNEIAPITDVRATKEYRMHMCGIMLERGLIAAVERLNGKGPKLGTRLI